MQAPGPKDMSMDTTSPSETTTNKYSMDEKDAAHAWAICLAEGKDEQKYPRVPVVEGPFKNFDEMWNAKAKGNHNPVNTFQRPTGPTHKEIALLQNLHRQGMCVDQIAAFLVVTFPNLMKGWNTGTEHERRLQIHGLVNLWISMWAPQVKEDGSIAQENTELESGRSNAKEGNKPQIPQWMREQNGSLIDY